MNSHPIRQSETDVTYYESEEGSKQRKKTFCKVCGKSADADSMLFHTKYKLNNYKSQIIKKSEVLESDLYLCPQIGCCFSANCEDLLLKHYENFEGK